MPTIDRMVSETITNKMLEMAEREVDRAITKHRLRNEIRSAFTVTVSAFLGQDTVMNGEIAFQDDDLEKVYYRFIVIHNGFVLRFNLLPFLMLSGKYGVEPEVNFNLENADTGKYVHVENATQMVVAIADAFIETMKGEGSDIK